MVAGDCKQTYCLKQVLGYKTIIGISIFLINMSDNSNDHTSLKFVVYM